MKVNRQPQKLKIENRKQYTKAKDFGQTAKVLFYTYLIFESCDGRYRAKMLKYPQEEVKGESPPMASEQTVVLHSRDEMCRKYKRRRIIAPPKFFIPAKP